MERERTGQETRPKPRRHPGGQEARLGGGREARPQGQPETETLPRLADPAPVTLCPPQHRFQSQNVRLLLARSSPIASGPEKLAPGLARKGDTAGTGDLRTGGSRAWPRFQRGRPPFALRPSPPSHPGAGGCLNSPLSAGAPASSRVPSLQAGVGGGSSGWKRAATASLKAPSVSASPTLHAATPTILAARPTNQSSAEAACRAPLTTWRSRDLRAYRQLPLRKPQQDLSQLTRLQPAGREGEEEPFHPVFLQHHRLRSPLEQVRRAGGDVL